MDQNYAQMANPLFSKRKFNTNNEKWNTVHANLTGEPTSLASLQVLHELLLHHFRCSINESCKRKGFHDGTKAITILSEVSKALKAKMQNKNAIRYHELAKQMGHNFISVSPGWYLEEIRSTWNQQQSQWKNIQ